MYIDAHNSFSDADAVTATAASESVVDLGQARKGAGEPLRIVCQVETTFVSAALDGTLTVGVQSDSAEAFGTVVTHVSSAAIAEASLVAGYRFELPPLPDNVGRYVRLYYTVAGSGNFTAGKLDASLVIDKQSNHYEAIASWQ